MNNINFKIQGLSLIEVLITIVISSIGLMGLLSLQMQSLRATSDTGNRSHAIWLQADMINRIKANMGAKASYVTTNDNICIPQKGEDAASTPEIPIKQCSSYYTGSNSVPSATDCTAEELAAWDLFEVSCGLPQDDDIRGSAISYLPDSEFEIKCQTSACEIVYVSLTWKARVDREEITGAARTKDSGILSLPAIGI